MRNLTNKANKNMVNKRSKKAAKQLNKSDDPRKYKYSSCICRDCGEKHTIPKKQFSYRTPPKCAKCGGMLDKVAHIKQLKKEAGVPKYQLRFQCLACDTKFIYSKYECCPKCGKDFTDRTGFRKIELII